VTRYGYDGRGHLASAEVVGTVRVDYDLDAYGRRVTKRRNGTVENRYLYRNQLQPAAEVDAAGNVLTRYVYARGELAPDLMERAGASYALLKDERGSIRAVVDVFTGVVAQALEYDPWKSLTRDDPFGKVTSDTNPGFQPFGFAGGLYDADTGLVHFGAREYDAETGSFTRADPSGFAGERTGMRMPGATRLILSTRMGISSPPWSWGPRSWGQRRGSSATQRPASTRPWTRHARATIVPQFEGQPATVPWSGPSLAASAPGLELRAHRRSTARTRILTQAARSIMARVTENDRRPQGGSVRRPTMTRISPPIGPLRQTAEKRTKTKRSGSAKTELRRKCEVKPTMKSTRQGIAICEKTVNGHGK